MFLLGAIMALPGSLLMIFAPLGEMLEDLFGFSILPFWM